MELKANSLGDHRSYLSGHFLRFLIISSHSFKFWLYISLSSLFMTNTMLLRVNSIFCHSPIFLEEILHYGSQSGMCSSSLSILYHIVIKKWTYRHQFLYSIAWNCLSLHPGLCLALHRVLHRICFSNPMINLPRRDLNHNQPGKVAGWGSGGRGGGRG